MNLSSNEWCVLFPEMEMVPRCATLKALLVRGLLSSQSGSCVDDLMSQNRLAMRAPKQPVMVHGCLESDVLESFPKWQP